MVPRRFSKVFYVFVSIFLVCLFVTTRAYTQEREDVSAKDLQEIVSLIEDPQRREGFVKDLRNLIRVREATKKGAEPSSVGAKRQALFIEDLFAEFETLSGRIVAAASSSIAWVSKLPEALGRTKTFLVQPESRNRLLKLMGNILLSIIIAMVIRLILRRRLSRSWENGESLGSKLSLGSLRLILTMIPYGAVLVSLFVLFHFFPSFPTGHSLSILFFTILFFYRLSIEVFGALVSPDNASMRIIPSSDDNANYVWVWFLRFAHYTAFYILITRVLLVTGVAPEIYSFIRGLLLIVFPMMISILIMQVAREINVKYEGATKNHGGDEGEKRGSRTFMRPIFRYWPLLGGAYSWIIFVFLITQNDKGFYYLFEGTLWTAVTILALLVSLRLLHSAFEKFFAVNQRVKVRFPGLEERTNRYIVILRRVFRATLIIIGLGVTAHIWGMPIVSMVASKTGSLIILRAVAIIIAAGVVLAVMETSQFVSEYFLKQRKKKKVTQKAKTLLPVANTAIKIGAGFIGGIVILDQLGVDTTPILAGAGIVGLAVGFGSQTLVKDLINGLFMLFEESVRVGDFVDLGKNSGIVEAIGLRTVRLRDLSGNVHVVPNSSIDAVTNMSKEFSRAVIDVGVAYREDVDEVIEVLKEIGEEMRNDAEYGKSILEPMEVFGLQSFDDSAVIIRVRLTTKPLKQWGIKREFNKRVKKKFDQLGIEIPFPHRTIYMGEPKKGAAPPIHVQVGAGKVDPV